MRRFSVKRLVFLLVIIAIAVFVGTRFITPKQDEQARLFTVKRADLIKKITISGKLTPKRKTLITAPYNGYIKKLYVKIGQSVKAGDPLVSIVKSLQINEKEYPLRAPYAGIVVLLPQSEGEYVAANTTNPSDAILRIDDLSQLFVKASVPEINILNVKLGQVAEVRATPILNKQYKGIVRDISLATQASSSNPFAQSQSNYPVLLEIINPDDELRPGMSILADIIAAEKKQVLVLPHEYIHREGKQYYVILANGIRQDIQLGLQNNQFAEITHGLQVGQQVKQVDYLTGTD